jgi:hypothetical protein
MTAVAGSNVKLPRNYEYPASLTYDLNLEGFPSSIKTPELRRAAEVYSENFKRMASMLALPCHLIRLASMMPECSRRAARQIFGADDLSQVDPALLKRHLAEFLQLEKQVMNLDANRDETDENKNARLEWGARHVGILAVSLGDVGELGVDALFFSATVQAWTAFETFAGDLWVAAVNVSPAGLARLDGTENRIEKKSGGNSSGRSQEANSANKKGRKAVSLDHLHELTRGTFDLSHRMGDLLRKRCIFTTLEGIRAAYSSAFSEGEKRTRTASIDESLADKSLDALCAVRNLIAHCAGVADAVYQEKRKSAPSAPQLEPGQAWKPTGAQVRDLIQPVAKCCIKLAGAVDNWLVQTR